MGWVERHASAALAAGKETRYPLYRGLGGPRAWCGRGAENLTTTGIRSPDRPVHNKSLYRLHHPDPQKSILRFKRKIKERKLEKERKEKERKKERKKDGEEYGREVIKRE